MWDGPYLLPAEATEADLEAAIAAWTTALKAACARAEAALS